MAPFSVKILGSNSAVPAYKRNHTSQVLHINNTYCMIDCGEGTQIQCNRYKVKQNKIRYIMISHLHGDHFLGLFGLISSMSLNGRKAPLQVFGPRGLGEIITIQLKYSQTVLNYELIFHELNPVDSETIIDESTFTVTSFPLNHRIDCTGFLIKEKPKKHRLDKGRVPGDISLAEIATLKQNQDVLHDNGSIKYAASELVLPPRRSRSYAYCSDTKIKPELIEYIEGVDLLYHETTFLEDMADRAENTFHTTTKQAANLAATAKVGKLIMGHFSSRYRELQPFLDEARPLFEQSHLALEGRIFEVPD